MFKFGKFSDWTSKNESTKGSETLQNAEVLRDIIDFLPTPVFVKDAQLRFVLVNNAHAKTFGTDIAKIIGKTDADIHPKEFAEGFTRKDLALLDSRGLSVNEETVLDANGDTMICQTRKAVLRTNSGESYIVGLNTDISEIKKREAQLQLITNAIPAGVMQIHQDGTIVFCNTKAVELLKLASTPRLLSELQNHFADAPNNFPQTSCSFEASIALSDLSSCKLLVMSSGWQNLVGENQSSAIISIIDVTTMAQLQQGFSDQSTKLAAVVQQADVSLATVAVSTGKLNGGAQQLAGQAEHQMADLEEIAAAMQQLSAAISQNATASDEALANAVAASEAAAAGMKIAAITQAAMSRIAEAQQRIDTITEVINDIAQQTNILSLNAAVEAARSGEAGRGFAVVAAEVRALSQRSRSALKDIQVQVTDSKHLVNEGGQALSQLSAGIKIIADRSQQTRSLVESISLAGLEQSKGVKSIESSIRTLESAAQGTANLADHVKAAVSVVDNAVLQLSKSVVEARTLTAVSEAANIKPGIRKTA